MRALNEGQKSALRSTDVQTLSSDFEVRPITDGNPSDVFWLMRSNRRYYHDLG
ncbi:MAG: hypothetical protein J6D34_09320 [Atopobiaceae bacterium]|nr:hypothetical protein [Atopobiaceae bacterium]